MTESTPTATPPSSSVPTTGVTPAKAAAQPAPPAPVEAPAEDGVYLRISSQNADRFTAEVDGNTYTLSTTPEKFTSEVAKELRLLALHSGVAVEDVEPEHQTTGVVVRDFAELTKGD